MTSILATKVLYNSLAKRKYFSIWCIICTPKDDNAIPFAIYENMTILKM